METNYNKIKNMDIDTMAEWIRREQLISLFDGSALSKPTIIKWLQQEVK